MRMNYLKPLFVLLGAGLAVSSIYIAPSNAASSGGGSDSSALLQQIVDNTAGILKQVDNLPTYLQNLSEMAAQWTTADNSDATSNTQSNFTLLGNLLNQDMQTQTSLMDQINKDMFGDEDGTKLPNYNDLLYTSILSASSSQDKKKQSAAYNYVKNTAGLTIPHILPGSSWQGDQKTQLKYIGLYDTTMAIESFNGYILGNQYADANQLNTLQTTLVTQATDPTNWFAAIASENIGWVLRQILMYESQVFVLMTQFIQTQKQMVSAQAMTNSLLIINNMGYESTLLSAAQGKKQASA